MRHDRSDPLLPPRRPNVWGHYVVAALFTALIAWTVHLAATHAAASDVSGTVETLLPLTRLGVLLAPLVVAFRGGVAALMVWLACGSLNERVSLRTAAVIVLTWLPVLEAPALLDALSVLVGPAGTWADAHITVGLDALITEGSSRMRTLAHSLNLALLAWIVLVARALRPQLHRGYAVALPATTGAAAVLVVLPLLRA